MTLAGGRRSFSRDLRSVPEITQVPLLRDAAALLVRHSQEHRWIYKANAFMGSDVCPLSSCILKEAA